MKRNRPPTAFGVRMLSSLCEYVYPIILIPPTTPPKFEMRAAMRATTSHFACAMKAPVGRADRREGPLSPSARSALTERSKPSKELAVRDMLAEAPEDMSCGDTRRHSGTLKQRNAYFRKNPAAETIFTSLMEPSMLLKTTCCTIHAVWKIPSKSVSHELFDLF